MTDTTAPHSPIDELSERFLVAHAELSPAAATIMGVQGYDDKLPDRSPGGFDALLDLHRTTIAEAKAVEVSSFREETAKDALLERIELEAERYEAGCTAVRAERDLLRAGRDPRGLRPDADGDRSGLGESRRAS